MDKGLLDLRKRELDGLHQEMRFERAVRLVLILAGFLGGTLVCLAGIDELGRASANTHEEVMRLRDDEVRIAVALSSASERVARAHQLERLLEREVDHERRGASSATTSWNARDQRFASYLSCGPDCTRASFAPEPSETEPAPRALVDVIEFAIRGERIAVANDAGRTLLGALVIVGLLILSPQLFAAVWQALRAIFEAARRLLRRDSGAASSSNKTVEPGTDDSG